MSRKVSPFLDPGSHSKVDSLAVIYISRDDLQPLYLRDTQGQEHDGYAEGAVFNTRFGSYPHSTFLNMPWGSQIRASKVDTGSRGRKRKRQDEPAAGPGEQLGEGDNTPKEDGPREIETASTGFVHILPPTPELWTLSLPHRTQVVYTPDYSYILQRIRARPGTRLIEAGAGSGSFTHAAARAVYNGYPTDADNQRRGKVFSFEYDETRFHKMTADIKSHQLGGLVHLTHRDVYQDGFRVDGESLEAEAVFLDLPAPWRALPHLSRRRVGNAGAGEVNGDGAQEDDQKWVSPLHPKKTIYICTFSPCIEQVTRTISTMRRLGWLDIETVEIANKRIHVYRDRPSSQTPQAPSSVMEAVKRLKSIEDKARLHSNGPRAEKTLTAMEIDEEPAESAGESKAVPNGDHTPHRAKPWLEGDLLTRTEPDVKTHTSYLVFAVLPREWTEEEEAAALERWPCGNEKKIIGSLNREARKAQKRQELMQKTKAKKGVRGDGEDDATAS